MKTLRRNARYSFRLLRKNPGFTAVATLTLALGLACHVPANKASKVDPMVALRYE